MENFFSEIDSATKATNKVIILEDANLCSKKLDDTKYKNKKGTAGVVAKALINPHLC